MQCSMSRLHWHRQHHLFLLIFVCFFAAVGAFRKPLKSAQIHRHESKAHLNAHNKGMNPLKVVALKQLKLAAVKSDDGFPSASLREISLLLEIEHPNVVRCREVARNLVVRESCKIKDQLNLLLFLVLCLEVVGNTLQHIFMVMEYVEHELRVLLAKHKFAVAEMKCLLVQLLRGVGHLHQCWILHRDLKTSNILLDKTPG